jgi:hypothetical protein
MRTSQLNLSRVSKTDSRPPHIPQTECNVQPKRDECQPLLAGAQARVHTRGLHPLAEGLKLVHFSAQPEPSLPLNSSTYPYKVELKSERV